MATKHTDPVIPKLVTPPILANAGLDPDSLMKAFAKGGEIDQYMKELDRAEQAAAYAERLKGVSIDPVPTRGEQPMELENLTVVTPPPQLAAPTEESDEDSLAAAVWGNRRLRRKKVA